MSNTVILPGLVLIVGAFILPFVGMKLRNALLLALPLLALVLIWSVPDGSVMTVSWFGFELTPLRGDRLARVFGTVFSLMAFAGGLYSFNQPRTLELTSAYIYAGAALGVVFAADLLTVFIFWELMALASTMVIWSAGREAWGPGIRYAIIHLLGGVILMAGVAGQIWTTGDIAFDVMALDGWPRWLILAGFLINAGAPPLQAWLPDAYPASSWSGMVFLSAFTTKTAVYVLMRGFPGAEILIWFGLFMACYGIVFAILENDMRRILAYSIINQVGFMVTGIGIGTELALNGAAAHAFAHIIYKALLLMSAGSVLYMTGKSKCTDLGGLFRTMPVSTICGTIGALAISAFPLTSGFISKSMINSAAGEEHLAIVWFVLAAATAGVFLHAGIKFPWFVFFQKDSGMRPKDPPKNMQAAMWLLSAICIGLGVFPQPLYAILPYPVDYHPYTGSHVVQQLQLLLFSGLAFFLLLKQLKRTRTITLDIDWLWRGIGPTVAVGLAGWASAWRGVALGRMGQGLGALVSTLRRHHGPEGILGGTWPTGVMAFWTTVLLAGLLLAYYI